jgi:hypothetical protein
VGLPQFLLRAPPLTRGCLPQVLDDKADTVCKVLQTAGVVSLQVRRLPVIEWQSPSTSSVMHTAA